MASYYNFILIDLNNFTAPPLDEEGQYNFHNYSSIENVSIGKIENRAINYAASEIIDLLLSSKLVKLSEEKVYKTFFGNLFWLGDEGFKESEELYLKDAWALRMTNEQFDFYSLNTKSLKKIISLENEIDFTIILNFFDRVELDKKRFAISFNEFFELTQDWLTLYKLAVVKNLAVVYDIG